MDKLRKSFNSFADQTHQNQSPEERYVLLHQQQDDPMAQREVVVKINGQNSPRETELSSPLPLPLPSPSNTNDVSTNRVWRDSSYDFSNDETAKVVREFDFAADSPPMSKIDESPSYGQFTPREARVSFTEATVHRRSSASTAAAGCGGDEVVVCSSNSSFGRKSTLMREKTKSRLMDPPDADHRSRVLKSGRLGKASESDEDDPFLEEDLPLEYKRMQFNALSYVIETLSGHPWIEIQQEQEEEEKIIAEVEKLQNAGANVPAELKANVFARREKVIGSGRHQRSPKSAKGTPRCIHIEDLMRFLREDEALKTMRLFEGAREGKGISKRALKNWVVNAIRERRDLAEGKGKEKS
ncbi:mechanosensitive ion channel family protein [Actinidia rufa]|uniref:Mechanosensitive ion channel family protein n=1 Tax=Actinidia rufa TaxID=165716 RepID=A0A7J0EII6_9ERIC|nr:mechanosensitive ion channel family protein [Actinidia rufa]